MRKSSLLISLLVGLAASPSFAQKRDDKDELATSETAAKNVIKPESAEEAMQQAENSETEKLIAENEAKLSEVRQRQIREMRGILDKNPLYKNKADLLFRIAEKEWDEAKYRYFLARKEYDAQYAAYADGRLTKQPTEPVPDYSKAITEYKKLLKEFPNYNRIDEVMFYLGRGLITAGEKKQGTSYMLRLTKDFPQSKYASRAYLAVAEYYFDQDLLFAAKTNYLKVLEDKNSTEYAYALYKLGYVQYNMHEYEEAITSFQEVAQKSEGQSYFTLQAHVALGMSYCEVENGWQRARDYYRNAGGDKLMVDQLERMARTYDKQDKTDQEVEVYEFLISNSKNGPKLPEYASAITEVAKKGEDLDLIDKTINRFYKDLDPKGPWHVANAKNEEAMSRSLEYRENELDYLITSYHKKAQELEEKKALAQAGELYTKAAVYYERYLADFPEAPNNYEMEFYLAEIYFFQTKEWDRAAEHYRSVVKRNPTGEYSKESAYAVILCAEEKMADAGLIKRPQRSTKNAKDSKEAKGKTQRAGSVEYTKTADDNFKPKPETPLAPEEEKFLTACKEYVDLYPKDEEVPFVSFRAAEIFINKGHYAEGISRLEVIMEHHPKHEYAGHAAATLFDSNYRLRRWDQMERWGRYMLERKNYEVLSQSQLRDVIAISIHEHAQELSQAGKKTEAANEMMRFVKEFPKHEKAPIALFNAAAITEEAEQTERAIELYESLIATYPKTQQATEAHFVLGALYESQTDFETAATWFEKMASFPEVEQMADALYNAGSIRGALEQYDQAVKIYETYVQKFPNTKDASDLMFTIADYQIKLGRYNDAQKTYDRYVQKYGKSLPESLVKLHLCKAKAYQQAGGKNARKDATRELELAGKTFSKLNTDQQVQKPVRRAAAEALFLQGEYAFEDFSAIEVRFPYNVLRKTLVQKATKLESAQKIYEAVLDYQAYDVGAGALYRLGELYYLFAKSLFDLPVPEELNEDEQMIYRAELDDQASPLHEKSVEALHYALKLAHDNHIYNQWSLKSASLLVKLSPDTFPVLGDESINTTLTVPATFSTKFVEDPQGELSHGLDAHAASAETPVADENAKESADVEAGGEAK